MVKRDSIAGNVLCIPSQMKTKHQYLAVGSQFERRFLSDLRACEVGELNFHHISCGPVQTSECAHSHEQFHAAACGHGQLGSECDQF